jgi:mannan endo-1,4-beta-mannosidase
LVFNLVSCQNRKTPAILKSEYTISGDKILNSGKPIQLIGANAFHSFGASTTSNDAMKSWNIDIAREFIGNIKENPISARKRTKTMTTFLSR